MEQWKLGRLIQTFSGSDDHMRVAIVSSATRACKRPIHKLCPLLFQQQFGWELFCLYPLKVGDVLVCSNRQKWPELWCDGDWHLHHNNVPAHTSLKKTQILAHDNMFVIPHHLPNSPDLAPCNFALFSKLKMQLKERWCASVLDIQRES